MTRLTLLMAAPWIVSYRAPIMLQADLFEKLLTRSRELNWSWGNLSSWIYPLDFVE